MVTYTVYRDSKGNRKIEYYQGSEKITTVELSKKEFEEQYGKRGNRSTRTAVIAEADKINKKAEEQAEEEILVDASGKELSSYESAAIKKTSGASTDAATGETRYNSIQVIRPDPTPKPAAVQRPPSTVSAASESEKRAMKRGKSFFGQVGLGAKEALTGDAEASERVRSDYGATFGERAGYAGGLILSIASVNPATQATRTAVGASTKAYATFLKGANWGTRVTTSAAVGIGVPVITTKGVDKAADRIQARNNPMTRQYLLSGTAEEARQAGLQAEGIKGVGRYVASIPIADKLVKRDEEAFSKGIKGYAAEKGITDTYFLEQSARQREKSRRYALTAGFLTANTLTEVQGAAGLAGVVPKSFFWGRFGQSAPRIGYQGVVEGTAVTTSEQIASGKNLRTFNYKEIAMGAVLGAVSAGTIGGTIYAANPAVGKVLLGASYLTDPFELAGDVTAGAGTRTITPVLIPNSITPTSSSTTVSSTAQTQASPSFTSSVVGVSIQTKVFTPTNVQATSVSTKINPYSYVSSNIFSPVSSRTSTFVGVNTRVQTNTPVNVNTPVSTNTPVNTFVTTPTPRFGFPLFPISLGGGGGRGKKGVFDSLKQTRVYQPSLSASVLNIKAPRPGALSVKTGLKLRPL